jgi:GT2 family glycosyltransferase
MAEENLTQQPEGPKVSAILLAFNQAPDLRRALEALDKSTDRDALEIVVADCGSHDGGQSMDAEFPSVTMLRMPRHFGAFRVMNIASRTAKADLLFFVSPNVEVNPDTAEKLAARMTAEEDCAAACPLLVDAQGSPVPRIYAFPGRNELARVCAGGELAPIQIDAAADHIDIDYPSMDALMVRKGFIRGMNFFDERRFGHYWADADLAGQIRRASKKARVYPSIHATYHPAPDPLEGDPNAEADRINGAAALLSKYNGGGGFGFKLGSALGALGRLDLGKVSRVLGGQKFDGK